MVANYFVMARGANRADLVDPNAHFTGIGIARTTYVDQNEVVGVPSDISGIPFLWAGGTDAYDNGIGQSMVWPSGFYRSVFRVVRDPAVAVDDSGDSLGTQVYNHGWLLAERLNMYLQDLHEYDLAWPPQGNLAVVPVTGTSAVNDGKGWHGMTSVFWPGPAVGAGTIRQLLSGDEGSTRKVAAIIDMLAATTATQRTTIGSTWTANKTAIETAMRALHAAAGYTDAGLTGTWPYPGLTAAQNQWPARWGLSARLGRGAIGTTPSKDPSGPVGRGVDAGLGAITAKECGLIGSTFTTAHYETMTAPLDAVLAMPAGY